MTIGIELPSEDLVLTVRRDFRWNFDNLTPSNTLIDFPPGRLYFELETSPLTLWEFVITGPTANLLVESEDVELVPDKTKWQLVWLPDGEAAGGDPLALGKVKVQGKR